MQKVLFTLCLFVFLPPAGVFSAEYKLTDFMRVVKPEGKRQAVSFDTAVSTFTGKDGLEVTLIAAVHVGDKEYYEELNQLFKKYDVVLYELVAEKGTKPDKQDASGRKDRSILSGVQTDMGQMLQLDFQLAHIDYRAGNMVHADLSPDEFSLLAARRGDVVQFIFNAFLLGIKKGGKEAAKEESQMQGRLFGALMFSANPSLSLKRFFSEELTRQADEAAVLLGSEGGTAIISDRNAAALKVLKQQIHIGKKKIAIFYGGAHCPEFAEKLEKDFHLQKQRTDWVVAWDLTKDRSARKRGVPGRTSGQPPVSAKGQ